MAKLNEQLKSELTFKRREVEPTLDGYRQIIISTEHKGIYRQYSFHVGGNAHDPLDIDRLIEEAEYILTHSIDSALNKSHK